MTKSFQGSPLVAASAPSVATSLIHSFLVFLPVLRLQGVFEVLAAKLFKNQIFLLKSENKSILLLAESLKLEMKWFQETSPCLPFTPKNHQNFMLGGDVGSHYFSWESFWEPFPQTTMRKGGQPKQTHIFSITMCAVCSCACGGVLICMHIEYVVSMHARVCMYLHVCMLHYGVMHT